MCRTMLAVAVSGVRVVERMQRFGDLGVVHRRDIAAQAQHRDDADCHQHHCDDCQYAEKQLAAQRTGEPPGVSPDAVLGARVIPVAAAYIQCRGRSGSSASCRSRSSSSGRRCRGRRCWCDRRSRSSRPGRGFRTAQRPAGIAHQEAQQFELGRGKRYRRAVAVTSRLAASTRRSPTLSVSATGGVS